MLQNLYEQKRNNHESTEDTDVLELPQIWFTLFGLIFDRN